jgi:hypothetical protein
MAARCEGSYSAIAMIRHEIADALRFSGSATRRVHGLFKATPRQNCLH